MRLHLKAMQGCGRHQGECCINSWATPHRYCKNKIAIVFLGSGCFDSLNNFLPCPLLHVFWRFLLCVGASEHPLLRYKVIQISVFPMHVMYFQRILCCGMWPPWIHSRPRLKLTNQYSMWLSLGGSGVYSLMPSRSKLRGWLYLIGSCRAPNIESLLPEAHGTLWSAGRYTYRER
jgi:hypothetical protein